MMRKTDRNTRSLLSGWLGALLLCLFLSACGPQQAGEGGYTLDELALHSVGPLEWLHGTRVVIEGQGFVHPAVGTMSAILEGSAAGQPVAVAVYLDYAGPGTASFTVGQALLQELPLDLGPFSGILTVTRTGERGVSGTASLGLGVDVVSTLTPSVSALTPTNAFLGEEMELRGGGFLFSGESAQGGTGSVAIPGATVIELNGTFTETDGGGTQQKMGVAIPVSVTDRTRATFVLTPDLFGLGPGTFQGSVRVRNVFQGEEGTLLDVMGNELTGVSIQLGSTRLTSVWPAVIRRGQELVFEGRGFLGVDGDLGTVTFLAFTGNQSGPDESIVHTSVNPLVLVPDRVEGNYLASLVVRTLIGPKGWPTGFGSKPAILDGRFTPHVVYDDRILAGQGLDVRLEVGRQVQVVHLRFMPTFEDGLRSFGMEAVSEQVKARALEVCQGDYLGISMEFRLDEPLDWVEYTTAEVMNRDPNDAGLLGLDNTYGKDVGNLRLNDLLGGYNALSAEAGYFPYGGVFVESFLMFSPSLSELEASMTAMAFDMVFGPVIPALGGEAVAPGEYPGSGRDTEIGEAIRVLGNLVGDTVTHEVGHALGLAAIDGEFHNAGDNPGYIMDTGAFRPFEERAQLPGGNVRVFAPYNRTYLEEILPVE